MKSCFRYLVMSMIMVNVMVACSTTPKTSPDTLQSARTGQTGDVCARVDSPQCMDGLYCRPQQDRVSRCVEQEFAQEGEVCGTIANVQCGEGLACIFEGEPSRVTADGRGLCQRETSSPE